MTSWGPVQLCTSVKENVSNSDSNSASKGCVGCAHEVRTNSDPPRLSQSQRLLNAVSKACMHVAHPNGFCLLNHPLSQPTRNRITSELHLSHLDIFRNITVACPVLKHSRKGCSFFSHLEFSQDKLLLIIPIHTPETQHRDEQEKQTDTMNPKNLCPHVLQLSPPFPFSSSPPLRALVLL